MLSFITPGAVKREESLFQKAVDVDTQFVPTFTAPHLPRNASFTKNDVDRLCGNNVQCRFDFKVTGQKQIAEATIRTSQWFEALRTFQRPGTNNLYFSFPHQSVFLEFFLEIRTSLETKPNILQIIFVWSSWVFPCHGAQSFLRLE